MSQHKLDAEMLQSLIQMVESSDREDMILALSIMISLDTNDEYTVLSINKLNETLLSKCNGWSEFIKLKNEAHERVTSESGKYNESL